MITNKKTDIMKILNVAIAAGLMAAFIPAVAQNPDGTPAQAAIDRTAVDALKLKELNLRRESLQQQISVEDAKRNLSVNGVAPRTQELLNDRQDSVCLELRSQLADVELELQELTADADTDTRPAIVDQVGRLGSTL